MDRQKNYGKNVRIDYILADGDGKTLWSAGNKLEESPIETQTIRASCSDCHARDGRDLKYFGFSNFSIVERSIFHCLTEDEG